jgi:hypothetical protein
VIVGGTATVRAVSHGFNLVANMLLYQLSNAIIS